LKNFPYLLQVFDKVDAGKDGKLEQHEYQNLEMETKREGEIRVSGRAKRPASGKRHP